MSHGRVGIDIDSWKLTLCGIEVTEETPLVEWQQKALRVKKQSLFDAIQGVMSALALAISEFDFEVQEVYIERGRGLFRTADFELGAIYGATIVGIKRLLPNAYVGSITTQKWKKLVTGHTGTFTKAGVPGNGNAPKAEANAACRELLGRMGFTVTDAGSLSPDHLDAFGIVWSVGKEPPANRPKAQGKLIA